MSETPSSAVTTADHPRAGSHLGHAGGTAVSPMATLAADGTLAPPADAAAEHAAALALDEQGAHDLLWPASATVEFFLPDDAPLYAVSDADDWSGVAGETARAEGGGAPFDFIHDGDAGGSHVAAAARLAAGGSDAPLDTAAGRFADPLVDLGLADAAMDVAPPALDAPAQVDVAVDESARVGLAAPDVLGSELSWLAALSDAGLHVGEAWAWSDTAGGYVFDHCV
jgi:hypothetical protein